MYRRREGQYYFGVSNCLHFIVVVVWDDSAYGRALQPNLLACIGSGIGHDLLCAGNWKVGNG